MGTAGSFTVTATGFPTPTLSESGTLPSGVTFNTTTGVLSGTPASDTGGAYNLTFTAHNGVGSDATQPFTLTVNQATQAPAITSANSTTFAVGTAGSFTVTATGVPTPTLSESGTLPSGVTFNTTTGVLSGTPASNTGGVYNLTFTAHNGVGSDATQPLHPHRQPGAGHHQRQQHHLRGGHGGQLHGDGHRLPDPNAERERHVAQRRDVQ